MALEHESPQYEQRNIKTDHLAFGDVYTTHKDAVWGVVYDIGFTVHYLAYDSSKGSSRNWMEYLLPQKKLRTFLVSGMQPLDNGST